MIAAAGDVACDPAHTSFRGGEGRRNSCRQLAVSDLLLGDDISHVLALGDLQYFCGSKEAFAQSYDPSWGRVKDKTLPVPGNHEYVADKDLPPDPEHTGCDASNRNAAGYFDYFGAQAGNPAKGYYSLDIGTWHVVALNSNCREAGGCKQSSPQLEWLRQDLAAHPAPCTLAFWHHPRFSSGKYGVDDDYTDFWSELYAAGVDVVLNGHEHVYERFGPQDPSGQPDPARGIRQFIVGTGGSNQSDFVDVLPNSEVRENTTFGVLRMTLHPDRYDWEFVAAAGGVFADRGTDSCDGPRA